MYSELHRIRGLTFILNRGNLGGINQQEKKSLPTWVKHFKIIFHPIAQKRRGSVFIAHITVILYNSNND